jgi:hypothetical protein
VAQRQLSKRFIYRLWRGHRLLDVGLDPDDARQHCVVLNVPINKLMAIFVLRAGGETLRKEDGSP